MERERLISLLFDVYSCLNAIKSDIKEYAPLALDYRADDKPNKLTIRDRIDFVQEALIEIMDYA